MRLFIRKLNKLLIIVIILFLGLIFFKEIFEYIVHAQSFYHVALGDKAYRKGNYVEAIDLYRKALQLYPRHIKARYNLANIYVTYEDFESAETEYKTVLKYDPNYLNARINLGIILAEQFADFDQAIKQYSKVVNTKARIINIPFIYDNRQQLKDAKIVAYYDMGLAYSDKSLLYEPGSYMQRELLLSAADCYEKALKLNKKNYDAQYNLGLTAHMLGVYNDAATGYCNAMMLEPLEFEAHYNFAVLLQQNKMYKEAIEEFQNASLFMSDNGGDIYKTIYVFSMLNEANKMLMYENTHDPKAALERLDSEPSNPSLQHKKEETLQDIANSIKHKLKTTSPCKKYLTIK